VVGEVACRGLTTTALPSSSSLSAMMVVVDGGGYAPWALWPPLPLKRHCSVFIKQPATYKALFYKTPAKSQVSGHPVRLLSVTKGILHILYDVLYRGVRGQLP
jgi:hypothetical protein